MRLAVTLLQESCGLCKGHRNRHRGFGWNVQLECVSPLSTVACTLKQERYEEGCMHVLFVERVVNKTPHTCKECSDDGQVYGPAEAAATCLGEIP